MPWPCPNPECKTLVQLDNALACPACGTVKESWTLHADKTRQMVLSTKVQRLEARRGEGWPLTERVPVLSREEAQALADGAGPRPDQLLCVRIRPVKRQKRWKLTVAIEFERQRVVDQELEYDKDAIQLDADGAFDQLFLCVDQGAQDLSFPDVRVLDVGEETPLGHAPSLALSGFRVRDLRVALYRESAETEPEPVDGEWGPFGEAPDPVDPPRPDKTVHVLIVPEPTAFQVAEGKAVHGPLLQPGAVGDSVTLEGLAKVLKHAQASDAKQLLVTAHGSQKVSQLRAENALAFLEGRDAFAQHSEAHATVSDWQRLLKWIAAHKGWDCDPGEVDGLAFGGTARALDRFRTAYYKAFGKWLAPGFKQPRSGDWKALFDVCEERFGELLGGDPGPLRAAIQPLSPGAVGCGRDQASAAVELHQYLGLEDERLEVLLFNDADVPTAIEPPLPEVYGAFAYHAEHLGIEGGAHELLAKVVGEGDEPLGGFRYCVRQEGRTIREGLVAKDGTLRHYLPQGTYEVRVYGKPPENLAEDEDQDETGTSEEQLEALLRGDYQHKGRYRSDMSGFEDPVLQRFLENACTMAGCDPTELATSDMSGGSNGDSETGIKKGLPVWLKKLHVAAATSSQWGSFEQIYSRLMGAFYYAYFLESYYEPAGIPVPSNVEYFLLHLGMSTGNGGATFANIGAGDAPYCAAASSKAYVKGLEMHGYGTDAIGYAPGGPGVGHGCIVETSQGQHAGAEHTPNPGDVLSVKTAIGPPSGHVVTVAFAETDGTTSGAMWYVSGNAAFRAVSCDYMGVVGTNTRPPKGSVGVINNCRTSANQPHVLAGLSEAQLKALKIHVLEEQDEGEGGGPGAKEQQPPGILLARGDVPTFPVDSPGDATLLRVELGIVSFTVQRVGSEDPPGPKALVAPGCSLRLAWDVQGYERVMLQPGDVNLTKRSVEGDPTLELSPLDTPPDAQGTYTLEVHAGGQTRSAQVQAVGIFDFRVFGREVDGQSTRPAKAEVLQRTMEGGHPRYGTPFFNKVDSVAGLLGSFRALSFDSQDDQFWFWGQLSPLHDARVTWKVIWPDPFDLNLWINWEPGKGTGRQALPVRHPTCTQEGPFQVGEDSWFSDKKYRTFFDADLELAASGNVETCATIRLRENYEMPGIVNFHLTVDGNRVQDGDEVPDTAHPKVHYELKGSHKLNGLELRMFNAKNGGLVWSEIVRQRPEGEPPPAWYKEDTWNVRMSRDLPKGRLEVRCVLELQNRKGRVDSKEVTFVIPGPAHQIDDDSSNLPDEVKVALFDRDRARMSNVPYRLKMGGYVQEEVSGSGMVTLDLTKLGAPKPSFLLEWGNDGANNYIYKTTVYVAVDQGSADDKAAKRLQNLGYPLSRPLEENLKIFQGRHGLTVNGQADGATLSELTKQHDQHQVQKLDPPTKVVTRPPAGFP